MIEEGVVGRMTQRIVERFSPQKVIAFGSWARGEASPDSDIDFLVIMPYIGSKRDCQVSIRRELKEFPVPKDVIVISAEELEREYTRSWSFYKMAVSEGKVLYEL